MPAPPAHEHCGVRPEAAQDAQQAVQPLRSQAAQAAQAARMLAWLGLRQTQRGLRRAMAPTPSRPAAINAQVPGSGTGLARLMRRNSVGSEFRSRPPVPG